MIDIKEPYFITKGGLYYCKDYCGYTDNRAMAGIYEKSEALNYVSHEFSESIAVSAIDEFYNHVGAIDEMMSNLACVRRAILHNQSILSNQTTLLDRKIIAPVFNLDVRELELTVRSENCLLGAGIVTIGDLVRLDEGGLIRVKNMGKRAHNEITEMLTACGLRLGMTDCDIQDFTLPADSMLIQLGKI